MRISINPSIISFIALILISVSCEHSTEPKWNLDFKKMEIHYSKVGGWIQPTKLDIYGNGLAIAYSFTQSIDSAITILDKKKQNEIADLFKSFFSYNHYYEPKPEDWVTDQNTHTIILIYDGIPDTVSVYMPDKANIPLSLTKIIFEMELLWAHVLNKN